MKQWPKSGSKTTFKGTPEWFIFKNILEDANELLEIGKEYTITKIELASSWCAVILEEFPDKKFSLSWFNYEKELTTEEARQLERDAWNTVKYELIFKVFADDRNAFRKVASAAMKDGFESGYQAGYKSGLEAATRNRTQSNE